MELKEILEDITTKPVVPLWPHAGMVLDLSRNGAYQAVSRGEIDVIRIGRSIKVITASLRKRLAIG